jgi:uncharacterized protein (DUF1501 family)
LAPSSTATATAGPILVLLILYGGNDGLNTVVPVTDTHYQAQRGAIALPVATTLPLTDGYGLHPSMPGFQKLWQAGNLAIVHGVGYPDPNFSHFRSMDIWQSGVSNEDSSSGWLGRWLDATGSDPMRALAIGPTIPLALVGNKVQGSAIPPPPLVLPGTPALQAEYAGMAVIGHGSHGVSNPGFQADVAASGANLLAVQRMLAPVLNATQPAGGSSSASGSTSLETATPAATGTTNAPTTPSTAGSGASSIAGAPKTALGQQLDLVARMIDAGVPTKVYTVTFGGFDTHANQAPTQKTLLSQLDDAVTWFLPTVTNRARGRSVVMMIHTEFGRRVAGNASAGTDHGSANVVFVAGSTVHGGFYGTPPSLTTLDDGNLVFTTDFRSVYATLFSDAVGVEPKKFLGARYPTLGFLPS